MNGSNGQENNQMHVTKTGLKWNGVKTNALDAFGAGYVAVMTGAIAAYTAPTSPNLATIFGALGLASAAICGIRTKDTYEAVKNANKPHRPHPDARSHRLNGKTP